MLEMVNRLQTAVLNSAPNPKEDSRTWKPLRLLNLYRVTLAGLFVVLILYGDEPTFLGRYNPNAALTVSMLYLLFSMVSSFLIQWHWPRFYLQLYSQVLVDIIALTIIMHTSGGVSSGLGMLLVVAIAGGSVIMASRMANLFAAIATLAVLGEEIYAEALHLFPGSYNHAGMLGATFFATAILVFVLAKRLRESEELASQRGRDLANMAELNEHVIQRMQSGIIVVNPQNQVRLMNESAWVMLNMPSGPDDSLTLEHISPQLAAQLSAWWDKPAVGEPHVFRPTATATDIMPRFTRLGSDEKSDTLIFLEDTSVMAQQAQQMKLASLGRLTASIAHEVRNPLGAISHAGQLLSESSALTKSDRRLTEIIRNHSNRVNTMIENILQLSRREKSRPQTIDLKHWLETFTNEFIRDQHVDPKDIGMDVTPADTQVFMDPSQLHQVVWNLCQNGLRHSKEYKNQPKLEIQGGTSRDAGGPFVDIIDHGPGIDPDTAQQIFEPFFTTEPRGTGLGLYIARELCEVNQARLNYIPVPTGGSCFRINFSDPSRHR
jgi:two-component system sensor histidine kinase PilS (NtrC family)